MARILLIDDDPDILRIGSLLLHELDHDVVTFDNGKEALECLLRYSFDIIITDANMPVMSGFDVIKKIKSNPNWRHISVALLTARNSREDVEQGVKLGVDDYMVKPIDPLIFIEKVKILLEKNSPRNYPEVHIDPFENESKAYIQNEIKIEIISELGLLVSSHIKFNVGDIIRVGGTVFSELKLDAPYVKIVSVKPSTKEPNTWMLKTIYIGAKDQFLQKIRSWMNKQFLKKTG